MARQARVAPGGWIYHVSNRSAGRVKLFRNENDFAAFDLLLQEAIERNPLRIFSYCVLKDRWHFVVHPAKDGDLTAFFRWLTHTHTMRLRASQHSEGDGPVYGGRFKSFPVQPGASLLKVCRYVERSPVTAKVPAGAEEYAWGSLWVRAHGTPEQKAILSPWSERRPADWVGRVNKIIDPKESEAWGTCLARSRPFGDEVWTTKTVRKFGLEHTVRRQGRPMKQVEG